MLCFYYIIILLLFNIIETKFGEQNTTIGIVADAVSQVMDLAAGDIRAVPEFGTRIKVDYLLGMAQLGKKFALLLDVDKVLSTNELLNLSDLSANKTSDARN